MAGHSKWSQIKRKKAVNDRQRGKIISKHIRAIQSAVREGGGDDPSSNLPLKNALSAAKTDDVPQDNIDRAIERALGGTEGGDYEPVQYEGYGPGGIAVLVEALTDNRNRTASEVRHVFAKHGGNMSGSTAWQFETKGVVVLDGADEALQELAIDLGAEDLEIDGGTLTVYTSPTDLYQVVDGLQQAGHTPEVSQLGKFAQTETDLARSDAEKVVRFLEALEDLDDVQDVYSTANLDSVELVG
ncbi:MAG TPA: YebC/PmpR family DNA-binding transcriptional regulator [Trueperaceae bacterium]|nr:YebC/PmpR family DNA-binding transcriptional regulator [Trueperaceae bacterium]